MFLVAELVSDEVEVECMATKAFLPLQRGQ